MEEKSGRYYMVSALKKRHADRLPVTVLVGPYCSRLVGYSVKEILTDPKKSAEAHLAFYERYRPDSLTVYNDIYLELEAVGCELEYPEDSITHPKAPLLEDQGKLASLRVPDPEKDGRLPYYFEVLERVSADIRKTATLGVGQSGPWNLAMHLRGAERLLVESLTEPSFVHELMKYTTDVVRAVGDALIRAGFMPGMGEASASCSLISPQIYRDFIMPYHKELNDYFRSKGAPMTLHVCGYIDPIMEDILETGINFLSLDAPSSLERMVQVAGGRMTLMGNVPTGLFASGTREEMEAAVDACIRTAARDSGYILSSGCEIPINSTEDRVEHFFEYARSSSRSYLSRLKEERPELFAGS